MNLRSLIFQDSEGDKSPKKEEKVEKAVSFPTESQNSTPIVPDFSTTQKAQAIENLQNLADSCQPHIESVMELYEKGFDNLNLEGYDFYEYFKAVLSGGVDNPPVYEMAFNIGKGFDPTVTKEKLLTHADYYIQEIEKVYQNYVEKGNQRSNAITNEKNSENEKLKSEVSIIEGQIESLKQQLEQKNMALRMIDSKFAPELKDIECKLLANSTAKNKLMDSINKVVNGIKTNIK